MERVAESSARIGEVVGGTFELRECIGTSGVHLVFVAHDRVLDREVTIKLATTDATIETLRREARMLAAVKHPGVPSVYGYGVHGTTEYLVLELLRGTTLGAHRALRAARGGFAMHEVFAILAGIADALAVLHATGYAHGNLTAEAVVIASDGRIVVRDPKTVGDLIPGESGDVRTDIEALGFLAYELFTGDVWAGDSVDGLALPPDAKRVLRDLMPGDRALLPRDAAIIAASLRSVRRAEPATKPLTVVIADDDAAMRALRLHVLDASATRSGTNGLIGGRYELGRQLGKGGMGLVYEARHVQLGRPLALKMISPDYALDAAARARFQQEARLASEIVHSNLVPVIDFGEDEHIGPFMVMELLAGVSLAELSLTPLSVRRACDLLGQVTDAVAQIHARGIVHGDIKAENIMVCEEKVGPRVRRVAKLLDFGLARRVTSMHATSDMITGTPHYIAPERTTGGPATIASDVYALGVLGYLMFSGSLPFEGTATEIMIAHGRRIPDLLGERRGDAIDPAVQTLISRAMAKTVAERHPTASAFRYELNTVVDMLDFRERSARIARRGTLAPP